MAQGAGAAVHVQLVMGNLQVVHGRHGHHGKGFVHFKQVHVRYGPAGFFQHFSYCAHRRGGEPAGFLGMCSMSVQDS